MMYVRGTPQNKKIVQMWTIEILSCQSLREKKIKLNIHLCNNSLEDSEFGPI